MICKKCGKKLKTKEMFCTNCGYYNDSENESSNSLLQKDEPNLLDESIYETKEEYDYVKEFDLKADSSGTKDDEFFYKDEKFLEAYIGEDYKLIKKSFFNIYAFIFNWMYLLYRKMYVLGIIGMIITYFIIMTKSKYIIIFLLIIMLIIGFTFNKVYIFISKLKVEYILKKNQSIDSFTLESICQKKGGVKVSIALIIYLIFLTIIFFSMFTLYYNKDHNEKFWKENSENKATCNSLVKTANKSLESSNLVGTISEGACLIKVINQKKDYEIYLKLTSKNSIIYINYKTEDDFLIYNNDTSNIQELELKNANNTITEQEKNELKLKKEIEDSYNEIIMESKKEDKLIKENKNTNEKRNYIFTKEEIIR